MKWNQRNGNLSINQGRMRLTANGKNAQKDDAIPLSLFDPRFWNEESIRENFFLLRQYLYKSGKGLSDDQSLNDTKQMFQIWIRWKKLDLNFFLQIISQFHKGNPKMRFPFKKNPQEKFSQNTT